MITTPPGKILLNQYLIPIGISQNRLARAIGVPPRRINEIVLGKRAITADTALRLACYFGNGAADWMRLQTEYDLARALSRIANELDDITPTGHKRTAPARQEPGPPTPPGQIRRRMMR